MSALPTCSIPHRRKMVFLSGFAASVSPGVSSCPSWNCYAIRIPMDPNSSCANYSHCQVFITVQEAATAGVQSGTWVNVIPSKRPSAARVLQIVVVKREEISRILAPYKSSKESDSSGSEDEELDHGGLAAMYLPPAAAFNLGIDPLCGHVGGDDFETLVVSLYQTPAASLSIEKDGLPGAPRSQKQSCVLPLASKVKVSIVQAGRSLQWNQVDSTLSHFFHQDKVVSVGDMCTASVCHVGQNEGVKVPGSHCVEYQDELPEPGDDDSATKRPKHHRHSFVHFRVVSFEPSDSKQVIVRLNHTALYQDGTVRSAVPALHAQYANRTRMAESCPSAEAAMLNILRPSLLYSLMVAHRPMSLLLYGSRGVGKRHMVLRCTFLLGVHVIEFDCYEVLGADRAELPTFLERYAREAAKCAPSVLLLRRVNALVTQQPGAQASPGTEKDVLSNIVKDILPSNSILVGTVADIDDLDKGMRGVFSQEIEVETPDEKQRRRLLESLCMNMEVSSDTLADIARATAGRSLGDLAALSRLACHEAWISMGEKSSCTGMWKAKADEGHIKVKVEKDHFTEPLKRLQKKSAQALVGSPSIPNVKWEDVGGLGDAKSEIIDTVQLPLKHPELFASGVRKRSGLLLFGPPGTGKTLLAKAVATECQLNFMSVKGPELINMYIGESEKNIRDVFQRGRESRPCVIFFDEVDALAPARGRGSDSGGVMDRVVSQLLAELDGVQGNKDVYVIAATNRPDLVDPALLRPGRFDKLIYLGVSEDVAQRQKILEALTRKFRLSSDVCLTSIAERCPETSTGADFYALCSNALLNAIKGTITALEANLGPENVPAFLNSDESDEVEIEVRNDDFEVALKELRPSVSHEELAYYRSVQKSFLSGSK